MYIPLIEMLEIELNDAIQAFECSHAHLVTKNVRPQTSNDMKKQCNFKERNREIEM